jgi:hypothetical protein
LMYFKGDDEQHYCRYTKPNQAAAFLLNDAVSKLRLDSTCADAETCWSLYGAYPQEAQYGGQYLMFSLQQQLSAARKNPHRGSQVLRSVGWSCDLGASNLALTPASLQRTALLKWANGMLDLVEISVLPNGIGIDGRYPLADNGVPWTSYGMPLNCGAAPMFQVPIWANGIFGLVQQIPQPRDAVVRATVLKSADALYFSLPRKPSIWGGNAVGPPYYLVVSKDGIPTDVVSEGYGDSNWLHCWHHLALAYRASGDKKYLSAMANYGVPNADIKAVADKTWTLEAESVLK